MLTGSPRASKMATAVVESQPRYPMFYKAMNAIQKCGEVTKEKLLLDYDESEFAYKVQVTTTFTGYGVPRAIEESKQQRKSF